MRWRSFASVGSQWPLFPEADRLPKLSHVRRQVLLLVLVARQEVLHQVGHAVGKGIELVVQRVLGPALGVLQHGDEKERQDGRGGVDQQLLGVEVSYQGIARGPEDHQRHAEREEGRATDEVGG